MTPDGGRRTIEAGRTRERFRRNTATGIIKGTVDGRFGERGEDHLSGERLRRPASHSTSETVRSDGSSPDFAAELVGSGIEYVRYLRSILVSRQ